MKNLQFVVAILLVYQFLTVVNSKLKRFDDYKVFSVDIKTSDDLDKILNLEDDSAGYTFWNNLQIGRSADIMISPHKTDEFLNYLNQHLLNSTLLINNVQQLIDNEKMSTTQQKAPGTINWTSYQTLNSIYSWLDQLVIKYPLALTNYVIGTSYENRTIRGVMISHKPGNEIIFIESNIHAREWITSATATWILNELLTSADPEVISLATNYDWFIVPVLNVDGFVYTHERDRMWRKTRQPHSLTCTGADPNRNFNRNWRQYNGATNNPCSEIYAGPHPESEPEIRQFSRFFENMSNRVKLCYSFHSYGQVLMFPFGHTIIKPSNYKDLMSIGLSGQKAIRNRFQTEYAVGAISDIAYTVAGSSIDWAYGLNNLTLLYIFEFRDTLNGTHGFLLPTDEILPNALEVFDGIKAMILAAEDLGYL